MSAVIIIKCILMVIISLVNYKSDFYVKNLSRYMSLDNNILKLNEAKGTGSRFNFLEFANNTWQREHVFAAYSI